MLEAQGIYYVADETNIRRGTAMLVGRPDTPYHGGFYFFSVEFPSDYPWSPLKVLSLTQDGITRFNPNMYINGKVCLSILNTWHDGPQWTGIQTLESVLLIIMSDVLNKNPIQNEPAYSSTPFTDPLAQSYNRAVFHANISTAVCGMLNKPPAFAEPFIDTMKAEFRKHADVLIRLAADASLYDGRVENIPIFGMKSTYNFAGVSRKLNEVKNCFTDPHPE